MADQTENEYEPMKFKFSDEDLMTIFQVEDESTKEDTWKLYFDGASNVLGHDIGVILISPKENIAHLQPDWTLTVPTIWQNMKHALWAYKQP